MRERLRVSTVLGSATIKIQVAVHFVLSAPQVLQKFSSDHLPNEGKLEKCSPCYLEHVSPPNSLLGYKRGVNHVISYFPLLTEYLPSFSVHASLSNGAVPHAPRYFNFNSGETSSSVHIKHDRSSSKYCSSSLSNISNLTRFISITSS